MRNPAVCYAENSVSGLTGEFRRSFFRFAVGLTRLERLVDQTVTKVADPKVAVTTCDRETLVLPEARLPSDCHEGRLEVSAEDRTSVRRCRTGSRISRGARWEV